MKKKTTALLLGLGAMLLVLALILIVIERSGQTAEEAADWVIFLTLTNRSMSGQNLLIDNGEQDLIPRFVWPETDGATGA